MAGYFDKIIADSQRRLPVRVSGFDELELHYQGPGDANLDTPSTTDMPMPVQHPSQNQLSAHGQKAAAVSFEQPVARKSAEKGVTDTAEQIHNKHSHATELNPSNHTQSMSISTEATLPVKLDAKEIASQDATAQAKVVSEKPVADNAPTGAMNNLGRADAIDTSKPSIPGEQSETPVQHTHLKSDKVSGDMAVQKAKEQAQVITESALQDAKQHPKAASVTHEIPKVSAAHATTSPASVLNTSAVEKARPIFEPKQSARKNEIPTQTKEAPATLHIGQINILIEGSKKNKATDNKFREQETPKTDRLFMRSL